MQFIYYTYKDFELLLRSKLFRVSTHSQNANEGSPQVYVILFLSFYVVRDPYSVIIFTPCNDFRAANSLRAILKLRYSFNVCYIKVE